MPLDLPVPRLRLRGPDPLVDFLSGLPASANSLINSLNMVTKVYFPRVFLPITAASVFLVDAAITLCLYGGILWYYQVDLQWTVVFVPFLILLTLIAALSFGILLSGLTLFYRDFKHIVPFLDTDHDVHHSDFLFGSNHPREVSLVSLAQPDVRHRQRLPSVHLWARPCTGACFLISSTTAVSLFVFSVFYFRRTERMFADYV